MTSASDPQKEIRTLLGSCRIGFLATQGKAGPESSMAPYALHGESVLLHLSKLARHTANIEAHSTAGFMICTPETAIDSPLALPRLSLQGHVVPVPADEMVLAKQAYLHNIPDAPCSFDSFF